MKPIALLGGSFDPIHNGHLHIARTILTSGVANAVAFLPNASHNFKKNKVLLNFEQRYELVRSALEPGMEVWDDDSRGSGYTSELLKAIYARHPGQRFLFVIGSDNLPNLSNWHDFSWLRNNVEFLILPRPEYPIASVSILSINCSILEVIPSPISSTLIRQCIAEGKAITGLVPDHLEDRIKQLYQPLVKA